MADPSRDLFASNRLQLGRDSVDELRPATVLERARSFLARCQATDGHWPGLVYSSVRTTAEYVLLLGVLERIQKASDSPPSSIDDSDSEALIERRRCAAAHIAGQQLPSGFWSSGNREADLDASVLAYLALRVAGHESQSEHVERARSAILSAGGVNACEPMSRYWFAALGEIPFSQCWSLPIELGLLPSVVPGALARHHLLSRVVLVSMALLKAQSSSEQTSLAPTQERFIDELVSDSSVAQKRCPIRYKATDRVARWWPSKRQPPLRTVACHSALTWLCQQVDTEQGVHGDASATIWAALAILVSSSDQGDEAFCACLKFLESLTGSNQPSWDHQCSLAKTEVRSSAIAFRALGISGLSMVDVPMQRSVDWLLCRESHQALLPLAASEMSGWSVQGGSAHCIDAETTALVLLALREQFTEKPPEISRTEDSMVAIVRASSASFARRQVALLDRMAAASRRSRQWLVEIQNVDGGWGRFGRRPWRPKRKRANALRWSKDLQTADVSSVVSTGWVLEALSQWDHRREAVLNKAISFLRNTQESDGRWTETDQSILPTWRAISGMVSAGMSGEDPAIANAVAWLMSEQTKSGGWCDRIASTGPILPTVSVVHTAWAILGLIAAGVGNSSVVERGVRFLHQHQQADGGWGVDELARSYRASLDCGTCSQDSAAFPLLALATYHRVASP